MHDTPIRVDHVGIAVEAVTDEDSYPVESAPADAVYRWTTYRLGDASRIELVSPIAEDTFLTRYLEQYGPGLHHVTLEVADLDAVAETLSAEGIRVIDRTEYPDWTEAFVSPTNATGTLFQLMEFHPSFDDDRPTTEKPYVNGAPVSEVEP